MTYQLIEAEWRIYVSVQQNNIASDKGLMPVQHQTIIWSNVTMLSDRKEHISTKSYSLFKSFHSTCSRKYALENVVCEMAAILSRPQCVQVKVNTVTADDIVDKFGL